MARCKNTYVDNDFGNPHVGVVVIMSEESAVVQKFGAASKTRPPLPEQIKKIDDGPNVCLLFSGTIRVWGKGGVGHD